MPFAGLGSLSVWWKSFLTSPVMGDAIVAAFTSQQEDSTEMFRQVESFFEKSRQGLTDIGLSTNLGFFCARQMFDHVCPFEVQEMRDLFAAVTMAFADSTMSLNHNEEPREASERFRDDWVKVAKDHLPGNPTWKDILGGAGVS